ncbi:MAG: hypothetical protein ABWW70_02690 [Thermoproteota archaeon]
MGMLAYAAAEVASNITIANLPEIISANPKMAIAILIQFLLGLAAGYYTAKIAKYVIALVGVLVLGALIGAWGAAGGVEDMLERVSSQLAAFKDAVVGVMGLFGFLLVGPTAIGFVLGIVIGLLRR